MSKRVGIKLESVSVRFGETVALDEVSLDIRPGEFFSLLGPSGCGKTTLLRVIGGFEAPLSGRVFIGDLDVTSAAPQQRPTAMVFQSYALFPSMSVSDNVGYGLRLRGVPKSKAEAPVRTALERVGLEGLEQRNVTELSGGQQQRVALARAIAIEPQVLLFDEPLSNLDVALRERTRRELRRVQREVGHTSVYVTHDQQEALGLSDRIAVMSNGKIVQIGTPEQLYAEPSTAYVASFLGGASVVRDPESMRQLAGTRDIPDGHVLAVRPASIRPARSGAQATVRSEQFLGDYREVLLELRDGTELRAHWTSPTTVGSSVTVDTSDPKWVLPD